MEQFTEYTINR